MPPLRLLTRRAESLFSDREQNHGRVWGRKQQLFWYGVIHSALCTVLITFTSFGRIQFRMASMMRLLHAPASPVWPCATGPIGHGATFAYRRPMVRASRPASAVRPPRGRDGAARCALQHREES